MFSFLISSGALLSLLTFPLSPKWVFLSISLLFSLGEGAEQLGGWVNRKALFSTLNSVKVFQSSLSFSDFSPGFSGVSPAGQEMVDANLQKLTQLVNKESNLIEKVG